MNSIQYDRSSIVDVLRDLDQIVVSLDRIGAHVGGNDLTRNKHDQILGQFFDDWEVFRKLANARSVLGGAFSRELGDDDMEELERECQDVEYWSAERDGGTS